MGWDRTIAATLFFAVGACTSASLPTLPPPQPQSKADGSNMSQLPIETAVIAKGTPTEVYSLVARGALGCWFGADGPLKSSHVFQAEADPPAKGGAAEIVIHERDESLRDKRGPRAVRVAFTATSTGARVGITMIKMESHLADLMTKDIQSWAGGGRSCQARSLAPPQPPVAEKSKKGKAGK